MTPNRDPASLPALHTAIALASQWATRPETSREVDKAEEELARVEAALQAARRLLSVIDEHSTGSFGDAEDDVREALKESWDCD